MGTMIDVREYPEFASGHINGSRLVPLGGLTEASKSWNKAEARWSVKAANARSRDANSS
jgi:rhodanese-related sulfurtransferase